jgi:hypothetical protein
LPLSELLGRQPIIALVDEKAERALGQRSSE